MGRGKGTAFLSTLLSVDTCIIYFLQPYKVVIIFIFQQKFPKVIQLVRTRAKIPTHIYLIPDVLFISLCLAFHFIHNYSDNYILTSMKY